MNKKADIQNRGKRWVLPSVDEGKVEYLVSEINISPLQALLLINRGITDPKSALRYLSARMSDLYDPFLMKNMRKTVDRIMKAIVDGEKILVYGDFDVDGITSTLVLKKAIDSLDGNCSYYIPRRLTDGYGLKKEVVEQYKERGVSLVISVDCGIRAVDVGDYARNVELDLIITDHHVPGEKLPRAFTILDPKQEDCQYPDKSLAGVGVVYKLVEALYQTAGREGEEKEFLPFVAIGTIADLVSLTDENRIIVKNGLEALKKSQNVGLRTLIEMSGVKRKEISCIDVAFKVAPRINAVGRMGGSRAAVELFNSDDVDYVRNIVREMNRKNVLRQREEGYIHDEIERLEYENPELFNNTILVLAGKKWHRGVIGIVASRLVEKYRRPAIVLSVEDGEAHGSGRSMSKFHLLEALRYCDDLLVKYGGHALAAGLTLIPDNIDAFSKRINEYAAKVIDPKDLVPELFIDSYLELRQISFKLLDEINELAPFGEGNPIPVFATQNVKVYSGPWLLRDKHLKIKVGNVLQNFDAVWWKKGELFDRLIYQKKISIAYSILINEYNGVTNLQLNLKDIKFPEKD